MKPPFMSLHSGTVSENQEQDLWHQFSEHQGARDLLAAVKVLEMVHLVSWQQLLTSSEPVVQQHPLSLCSHPHELQQVYASYA